MAVSIAGAIGIATPHAGKNDVDYVMESDRASTLVMQWGGSLHPESQRGSWRALSLPSLDEALVVSTSHCAAT
ncbi:MAG TPA: hypothetical protein VGO49_05900 [Bradyrhizobium sp.]|jgi:hypothetical protein|nr:hypothetical protein [Bradyrhizobium sp.]